MIKLNNLPMENDDKWSNKIRYTVCFLSAAVLLFTLMWLTAVDYFTIVTSSMAPTIQPGERVRVVKLFGLRKIRPNDIIIFDKPVAASKEELYCKRVLGCPGDRIGAVDGHCWNDQYLKPVGVIEEQEKLRWMFDGFFRMANSFDVIPFTESDWNIKNWGPLIVPAKGLTMTLDDLTRELYRRVIEYETAGTLADSVNEYTFLKDYFFVVGDNTMSSFDSRYWGFIPEEFIKGIVGGRRFRNK